mgnify:CR=1 FL=1
MIGYYEFCLHSTLPLSCGYINEFYFLQVMWSEHETGFIRKSVHILTDVGKV